MNRDQKAAVIEEVAGQIKEAEAVFAVDYRGLSVQQAAELRRRLDEAGATLRVVKNTLTERAADKAGAESLKELLDGPTAFTFVRGDAALAAKAIATFHREHAVPEFKGGTMDGAALTVEELRAISQLPAREVLHGQLVGVLASPITGLVRGLNQLIQGLAVQLGQIAEQGLVGGGAADEAPADAEAPAADEPEAEAPAAPEEPQGADASAAAEASSDEPAEDEASGDEPAEDEASGDEPAEDEASGDEPAENETSGDEPAENNENEAPGEGDVEAKED